MYGCWLERMWECTDICCMHIHAHTYALNQRGSSGAQIGYVFFFACSYAKNAPRVQAP